jgi:ArsR family transcriptional regulator
VSRHLAYLRRADLVATRREGTWVHYRLSPPDGALHAKLLECLRCCLAEVPELQDDRKRLTDEDSPGGCC